MGNDAWLAATTARDNIAAQFWLFGAACGGLVVLTRKEWRGRMVLGLALLLGLVVLWG